MQRYTIPLLYHFLIYSIHQKLIYIQVFFEIKLFFFRQALDY